jgi:type IV pilus assembly protein PilN
MIRINLLPHREVRRKRQQRDFFVILMFVAGFGLTTWFGLHTYFGRELELQDGRNSYLEQEIAKLDRQIEEIKKLKEQTAAMLQRKNVVEALQANRSETVHLLDQLVRQLPDGVYLKAITQKGTRVTLNGYAQSNARVSTFMRNLEASPYLGDPNLIEIKGVTDKNIRLSEFTLAVSLTRSAAADAPASPGAKPPTVGAVPPTSAVGPAPSTGIANAAAPVQATLPPRVTTNSVLSTASDNSIRASSPALSGANPVR